MPLSKSHWCYSCRQKKKEQQWLYASILGVEGKERIKPKVNFMIVSTMKLPSWPNSFVCMRSSMGQWSNDCSWWPIFGQVIQEQDAQDIHHIIVSQVSNPKYNFQIDHKLNYEHKHHTLSGRNTQGSANTCYWKNVLYSWLCFLSVLLEGKHILLPSSILEALVVSKQYKGCTQQSRPECLLNFKRNSRWTTPCHGL